MNLLMDAETGNFWARVDFLLDNNVMLHLPEEYDMPDGVYVSKGGIAERYTLVSYRSEVRHGKSDREAD